MNKAITLLLLTILLSACGKSIHDKPRWEMNISEMFPGDQQAQELALAAIHGDIKQIKRLVDKGNNINSSGVDGTTVLGCFFYRSLDKKILPSKTVFKTLLELGADPNIIWKATREGFKDHSLLHAAVDNSPEIGVDYLMMALEIGKGNSNLAVNNWQGRIIEGSLHRNADEAFVTLYNAGAEVNYLDWFDRPFVLKAIQASNYEVAYFLLKQGSNFVLKDKRGNNVPKRLQWEINDSETDSVIQNVSSSNYPWFWLCVEFLEKKGFIFEIPPHIKRPTNLVRPQSYIFDNAIRRNLHN